MKKDHLKKRSMKTKKQSRPIDDASSRHFLTKQVLLRFLFYVCSLIFLCSLLYSFFYATFVRVATFDIVDADRVSLERIESLVAQSLEGTHFLRIPKNNLLLISSARLSKQISSNVVEIEEVKIEKVFPSTLRITVEEYDTIMIVCGKVPSVNDSNAPAQDACMTVDQDGFRGEQEDLSSEKLQANPTVVVRVDDLLPPNAGEVVFSPEIRDRLLYIIDELPYRLSFQAEGDPRLASLGSTHVEIPTDEGWTLLLDLMHEPLVSLRVLEAFFEQTRELDIRSNVTEIDIRLLDKIFYKKKEVESLKDDSEDLGAQQAQEQEGLEFRELNKESLQVEERLDVPDPPSVL